MRYLFLLLFNSVWVFSFSQQNDIEGKRDFTKLKPGMSEKQIIKCIGDPERIENFFTIKAGSNDTTVFWHYKNNYTLFITNHYLQFIERNYSQILVRLQDWADPRNKDSLKVIYSK